MADFCKQCSLQMFGEDHRDLAGIAPPDGVALALCENCGEILVNHDGERIFIKEKTVNWFIVGVVAALILAAFLLWRFG